MKDWLISFSIVIGLVAFTAGICLINFLAPNWFTLTTCTIVLIGCLTYLIHEMG